MEKKNLFRLERETITKKIIGSFTAKMFDFDNYVKASIPREWLPNSNDSKIIRIDKNDYEETLINILERPIEKENPPILILVGGIGTGKSTTIRYVINEANLCSDCNISDKCEKDNPFTTIIDFLIKPDIAPFKPVTAKELYEKPKVSEAEFWQHIMFEIDDKIEKENDMSVVDEISIFWNWLLKNAKRYLSYHLYNKLIQIKDLLKAPATYRNELISTRKEIYNSFTPETNAHYRLLQLAFLRRNYSNEKCNIMVFDNIDSIEPYLQLKVLDFSIKASKILNARAIIPMRPHTFTLNNLADDFIEIIEHWTPDISDVMKKRIYTFKTKSDNNLLALLLEDIRGKLCSNYLMKDVFIATTGGSIRYGLRNFYNFLLSHLIVTNSVTKKVEEFALHIFYQAFFCSETKNQIMYDKNFVNLFSLNLDHSKPFFSNIKLRLLHIVYYSKVIELSKITKELINFGYDLEHISQAINDLLNNKKALLWSNSGYSYSNQELFKNDWISITPLGIEYYSKLLAHPGYLIECIVSVDDKRNYHLPNIIRRLIDVLSELENNDYLETIYYLSNTTHSNYYKYYDKNISITSILWDKLSNNLNNLSSNQDEIEIDYLHAEYIKKNIYDIVINQKYPLNLILE